MWTGGNECGGGPAVMSFGTCLVRPWSCNGCGSVVGLVRYCVVSSWFGDNEVWALDRQWSRPVVVLVRYWRAWAE